MKHLILISAVILLSGCATKQSRLNEDGGGMSASEIMFGAKSVGNSEIKEIGKYRNIKEELSTKSNIYDEFGQPANVDSSSPPETKWIYYYATMSMSAANWIPFYGLFDGGTNQDISSAEFVFDAEGVLIELNTSEKKAQLKNLESLEAGKWDTSYIDKVEAEMDKLGLPFDLKKAQRLFGIAEAD
ncbi:hypothetical protein N9X63_00290 [Woeseiaceae bacterium]|nr:hypothetical protein [Woeseiaceae bacterium]